VDGAEVKDLAIMTAAKMSVAACTPKTISYTRFVTERADLISAFPLKSGVKKILFLAAIWFLDLRLKRSQLSTAAEGNSMTR
jgi:hypothetical protein